MDINDVKIGDRVLMLSPRYKGQHAVVTGFVFGTGKRVERDRPDHRRLRTDERRLVLVAIGARKVEARVRAESLRLLSDPDIATGVADNEPLRADREGGNTAGDVRE